ncbi:hypothetical protein PRIPAC_81914 [Pristionchus pacificus]|uniref:TIL domain-containing protein n=1 Tax=Pristionchus pacificus TaxID=54126 RepID=A0A2A6CK46_PRIPA|nr:hypothetical protein PRIPAC_80367 [Pristionchus pacificus]KAF8375485.1 hypothetical protein PRIPAC_81914 [Pristionchus pacificus]|eukprot:PDM78458.1 hypothetical protein PRIPAC_31037 [Pristionchus pacificus]
MIRCLIFVLLVIAATAAEQKKTQKASRVQNQEPIVSDIFLGVSQIICGAVGQCRPRNPCPFNTVFRQGCPCEPTCAIRNPPCNRQCARPRCQCRAGMVRNASGQCVLPRFCPVTPITCPPNQFWNTCPVLPEPSCQNPWPRCPQFCPIGARCQCRPGFYRATSAPNAPCVPWLTCWRFPWPRSNPLVPVATIAGRPQCWWGGPRTFPGIPG